MTYCEKCNKEKKTMKGEITYCQRNIYNVQVNNNVDIARRHNILPKTLRLVKFYMKERHNTKVVMFTNKVKRDNVIDDR